MLCTSSSPSSSSRTSSSAQSIDERLPVSSHADSRSSTPRSNDSGYDKNRANLGPPQSVQSVVGYVRPADDSAELGRFAVDRHPVRPHQSRDGRSSANDDVIFSASSAGVLLARRTSEMSDADASSELPPAVAVTPSCFPAGFGGWNVSRLYETRRGVAHVAAVTPASRTLSNGAHNTIMVPSSATSPRDENSQTDLETERRKNQVQAYLSWVNAQLKKKPGRQIIDDLTRDMNDGTAFADLIEVVAGESLPGIVYSPTTKKEMVLNVEKVITFMIDRNIRMHETLADDIVNGRVNSIMRLVLALAAHYKPNSVRESRNSATRSTFASYAQSAAVKLSDARRDAATVVNRPRRPQPLTDGSVSSSVTNSIQKSISQDFSSGHSEARYRSLAESYALLSHDHERLKMQYLGVVENHEDVLGQVKLLKKAVLVLQELLLNNAVDDSEKSSRDSDSLIQFSGRQVSADEVSLLCSRLLHSEETRKDIKEELSKMRNDCLKRQGAEVGLQQLVDEQQNVVRQCQSDLMKANLANQLLETSQAEMEAKLIEKDKEVAQLNREISSRNQELADFKQQMETLKFPKVHTDDRSDQFHCRLERVNSTECSKGPSVTVSILGSSVPPPLISKGQSIRNSSLSTKLVCFFGQNNTPNIFVIDKRIGDITLRDVQLASGRSGPIYRYHFQTHSASLGLVKQVISNEDAVVPSHDGTIMAWIEDEV